MINSVDNSSLVNASLQSGNPSLSPEEMLNKHFGNLGAENSEFGGVNSNVKEGDFGVENDLQSNVRHIRPKHSEEDNQDLGLFGDDNEDENGLSYDGKASSVTVSFDALAAEIGVSGEGITKGQLFAYLQSLVSDSSSGADKANEIAFVRNLIAKFDTISRGEDCITSFGDAGATLDAFADKPDDGVIYTFELRA